MLIKVFTSRLRHSMIEPHPKVLGICWYMCYHLGADKTTTYITKWKDKPTDSQIKQAAKAVATLGI